MPGTRSWQIVPCVVMFLPPFSFGCAAREDLLVVNARVWTGDSDRPTADAFVIKDGCFKFVGDESEARRLSGGNARILDAQGARIVPGLIDSHLHLVSGGLQLSRLNLRDAPNRQAFIAAVAKRARQTPKGHWILGGRWSTESWPDPAQPVKEWIDPVTPDHPVLLSRMDGHGAFANSVALKLAGIDKNGPPDPPGGVIERNPTTHEPTGILKDAAIELVAKHNPKPTFSQRLEAVRAAMFEANRFGVTTVSTMSDWDDADALQKMHPLRRQHLRAFVFVQEPTWSMFVERTRSFSVHDDFLRAIGFKAYMDGSLGSRTAFMHEPFSNQPQNRGLMASGPDTPKILASNFSAAMQARLQCAVHAIGDEGNRLLLNLYEEMEKANPQSSFHNPQSSRPRIEHAQHLLPTDIPRFAKLGVIASMQPYHKADDGRYAEKAIGPARCKTSYAFRSLIDAGAHVAFGSDWPVVSLNPFLGMHAAVTGKTLDGKVFVPEQNITIQEALRCYTAEGAYAVGMEDRLGKIKVGYLADFVVLDRDLLTVPPDEIAETKVKMTFVGGREVYRSP